MPAKKFLLSIVFLLLFCTLALADTFVVTSNADSGPGTLREALTLAAANGSAVKDHINFNIPDLSEAGRTIIIVSPLPEISSNLSIDGTTQSGTKFGVGDAKVKLEMSYYNNIAPWALFYIKQQKDIEIYGLYFYGDKIQIGTPAFPILTAPSYAIFATSSSNLVFGSPEKGNRFESFLIGLSVNSEFQYLSDDYVSSNIKVSSNICGLLSDGLSGDQPSNMAFDAVRDLVFGGETKAEGNIIYGQTAFQEDNRGQPHNTGKLIVKNNLFGTNYLGTEVIPAPSISQSIIATGFFLQEFDFANNIVAGGLSIQLHCFLKIHGNKFGTDITGTKVFDNISSAIVFGYCSGGGMLGGPNIEDGNLFSGYGNQAVPQGLSGVVLNIGSNNIELLNNVFRCNHISYPYQVTGDTQSFDYHPSDYYVTISNRSTNTISGTATPNSRVDLYYSLTCSNCEPEQLFKSVNTGANGIWQYNGPLLNHNIIAASTLNGATSEFSILRFTSEPNDIIVTPVCGPQLGSVKGIKVNTPAHYTWYDENNTIVSHAIDLIDKPAGKYYLVVDDSFCSITSAIYEIKSGPRIDDSNPIKTSANCNEPNGSIKNINITGGTGIIKYSWKNEQQIEVGTDLYLTGQPAGKYTLTVTDDSNCGPITSSPIEILIANDIAINTALKNIQDASCNVADGAITNIQVTGTGTYLWTNQQGVDVGHNKDLTGVPAGRYKLTVNSANCPPIATEFIEIPEVNGITIDETQKIINKATCQYDNGGISNIQVTGATKYTWYNAGNIAVSNNLDLTGMPTGNYYLIAANNNGCSKQTAVYAITRQAPVSYGTGLTKKLKNATCDENNGSIEVIFQNPSGVLPDSYKWVNTATGQVINTSTPILTGIDAGTYDIYAISNSCERYLINYSIGRDPGLTVVTNNIHKNDDYCSAGTGSIKGIQATGTTPLNFTWTDDNGVNKGASSDLLNVTAGTYHLKITDGSNCEQGFVYTIYDQTDALPPPNVSDVQLCSPGNALLSVNNANSKYGYRLYEDNNSAAPIDEQQNGRFKVNVTANRSYYMSQYVGNCESAREEFKVLISGISSADIANTFTPNGDGINDYWKITGMENYTNGTVKVFTREGKMIFQSKGYATPFDGTFNGKALPVGVYYYIIDLKSCNLLSGNLTIIR
nr:gliding motility-associated C-terminal domain-containing protein [Mucilaginibacter sp. L294]